MNFDLPQLITLYTFAMLCINYQNIAAIILLSECLTLVTHPLTCKPQPNEIMREGMAATDYVYIGI